MRAKHGNLFHGEDASPGAFWADAGHAAQRGPLGDGRQSTETCPSERPAMQFPEAPMAGLIDGPMTYDLAESTCPPLRLGDYLTPETVSELSDLTLGYGTTPGDTALRSAIA